MLFELRLTPLGNSSHLGAPLAEVLKLIDASGLPYQLTPSGTCLEGDWHEVMSVIHQCHQQLRKNSVHVITSIHIEDEEGVNDKLSHNLSSVREKAGRSLRMTASGE